MFQRNTRGEVEGPCLPESGATRIRLALDSLPFNFPVTQFQRQCGIVIRTHTSDTVSPAVFSQAQQCPHCLTLLSLSFLICKMGGYYNLPLSLALRIGGDVCEVPG